MAVPPYYLLPPLPEGLEGLGELALDLRWSWSHTTDRLWQRIAPELWARTRNPWLILQMVATTRLETLRDDPDFRRMLEEHVASQREIEGGLAWFQQTYPGVSLPIAYFSMEFGLSEALPIYSGGLGILAGDYLKTASDLAIPATGVGLLYQQGYFRQALDAEGQQMEFYPYNDPSQLPIVPVRNADGEWLHVNLDFPGRVLRLRAWEAKVGRVKLYLLDSNDPTNTPADRGITGELYGGGYEKRLQQEIILGIGGWRLLSAVGIAPEICHLNEGHAALAILERVYSFMRDRGQPFEASLVATRAGNIFTTHTPVEAGFDRFSPQMIEHYLGTYARKIGLGIEGLLALGRLDPVDKNEPFNMAFLAVRGAGVVNGVSQLHLEVSQRIFQPLFPRWPQREVPVTYVTNGVHMPSWDSAAADKIWSNTCGRARWLGNLRTVEGNLKQVPDETLWSFRRDGVQQLIRYVRARMVWQLAATGSPVDIMRESQQALDPNALTIGFARRFTAYKRPNLLLYDPERLARLLNDTSHPVQLIIAGKAHPDDAAGRAMIRDWALFTRRPDVRQRAVFLVDYDMVLAEQLTQGVDLWINTPRRPWEACGTSGMKILVNGGLNFSERDGWWAEAYRPEIGWALGDGQEHDDDPAWDAREAEELYQLLENEIIPCFFNRDGSGIPRAWVERVRNSMAELTPRFSANRMMREYLEKLYLPANEAYHKRIADGANLAKSLCRWKESLENHWSRVHFGRLEVKETDNHYDFSVPVYLDDLQPDAVQIQLYAEPSTDEKPEVYFMQKSEPLTGAVNGYRYAARIPLGRSQEDYTPRIIPACDGALVPLEANCILWYK